MVKTTQRPIIARILALTGPVLCVAALVVACAPMVATRGNFVDEERMQGIQLHVSSKDEVMQKLGSPTSIDPFDNNKWFYIGEKTETTAFYDPEVVERKILVVTFNEDGFLQSADILDENAARKVDLVRKKTPAPGREMNAFEQFVSNIGKFNQNAGAAQQVPPGR